MSSPADALLHNLFQNQLLDATQLAAIREWATQVGADPPTAARELVARGWLTPFQAREIAGGRTRGLMIGKYLLLDVLGEGGMGRVFKARDSRLGRDVALKVIRKDKLSNPKVLERFVQEVKSAGRLNHPNVVMSFDAEYSGDTYFLSMEYVEGTDLTKLVRTHGPMPMPHACDAIRQAAVGLQHAFEQGLVHRDIKPSNLLYTPRGQVKLLDLGLALLNQATASGGENANRVTQDGFVLGTPDFLAPEQAQNPTGVDIRADIYALGATLFYLLTARVPFEAATPTEKLLKHINEPPPNLLAYRPEAPPQLAGLIAWMMAKRPQDRPQTPAQVAMALAPFGLPQTGSFPVAHPGTPPAPLHVPTPTAAPEVIVPEPDPQPSTNVAFADLDAESREEPRERTQRDRDDDRPRRRGETRVREPKKASSLSLLLIGLGVMFVVCAGGCVGVFYFAAVMVEENKPLDAEYTTPVGKIKMVKIEAGSFQMGSPDDERGHQPDEGPVRTVTIGKPFYVGVTEVTRQQYFDVTDKWPKLDVPRVADKYKTRTPATVSWDEANEFLRLLNAKAQKKRGGWVFRLPTEAEWEYCARCGKGGPFGDKSAVKQYTNGIFKLDADDTYAESNQAVTGNYQFEDRPCPVGPPAEKDSDYQYRREPNEWGLYDMVGNVWELCQDRYDVYPTGPATDPTGPTTGTQRVARGGAFDTSATQCRPSSRKIVEPTKATPSVGFRIVYGPKLDR